MSATRQDAWSEDDDLLLAEVTLRHIREGGTQLQAFEEVGYRLGRTPAACGFRWNSLIRKKYESAIQIAKAQRQQMKAKGKKHFFSETGHNRMGDLHATASTMSNSEAEREQTEFAEENDPTHSLFKENMVPQNRDSLSYDDVIRFLRKQKETHKRVKQIDKQLQEKDAVISSLKKENVQMRKELNSIEGINEDYQALVKIMDRARKMAFLADEEHDDKLSFKMDRNGNLERVEKE